MQGEKKVVKALNAVLTDEMTAINQLFLHARMLKDWGLGEAGETAYKRSIRAMKDADEIIERVLFLEGLPNLQNLHKLLIGESLAETIDCDLKLQMNTRSGLVNAIGICEENADYVSRDMLVEILEELEEHIDWLETQIGLIDKMGIANYTQSQADGGPE